MKNSTLDWLDAETQNASTMDKEFQAIADYANVTRENKLNIMGLFHDINVRKFPYTHPQMFLILSFTYGAAEFGTMKKMKTVLLDQDGKQLFALEGTLAIPKSVPGARGRLFQIVVINQLKFEAPGSYCFSVMANDEEKATVPLRVNQTPDKTEAASA
jgi:hypothetical protein